MSFCGLHAMSSPPKLKSPAVRSRWIGTRMERLHIMCRKIDSAMPCLPSGSVQCSVEGALDVTHGMLLLVLLRERH